MSKPETRFIASVHKFLPPKEELHREKMNNPYRRGTPDVWYSGNGGDLWIEYKFIVRIPVRVEFLANLSEHQVDWLKSRYKEGRNVAVVIGHKDGGIILRDLSWQYPIVAPVILHRRAIADWITQETMKKSTNAKDVVDCSKSNGGRA